MALKGIQTGCISFAIDLPPLELDRTSGTVATDISRCEDALADLIVL